MLDRFGAISDAAVGEERTQSVRSGRDARPRPNRQAGVPSVACFWRALIMAAACARSLSLGWS